MNGYEQYDLLINSTGHAHAVHCRKNKQNAVLSRHDIDDVRTHQDLYAVVEQVLESDVFLRKVNRMSLTLAHHALEVMDKVHFVKHDKTITESKSKGEKEYDDHMSMVRRTIFAVATRENTRETVPLVSPRDWRPAPIYTWPWMSGSERSV